MSYLADLIKRYKDEVNPNILVTYKRPDEYVILNREDPDLHEIWIKLPQPGQEWKVHTINHNFATIKMPELHEMKNWGLPIHKQKFAKEKMPKRLADLIKNHDNNPDTIWDILTENSGVDWYDEIQWVKKIIRKRYTGEWQFIKGKPTYIDGWHFIYLNLWLFADMTAPDYRDKDRRWYHAVKYAYTTTECPVFGANGRMLYEETPYGRKPIIKEMGRRTMLGYQYPKGRRDGATNKHLCAQYLETIDRIQVYSGIIADTGGKSEEIYKTILLPGWRRLPFFMKPMVGGYDDPAKVLSFKPQKNLKQSSEEKEKVKALALRSEIDFAEKASGSFYDGRKMFWLLCDEGGKTTAEKVDERHKILVPCIAQGNRAVVGGFMGYPSTVGEMEKKGGESYFRLSRLSHWQDRDALGQTPSGLMNFFFPAHDGLEGYIDEYGDTVIDTPKEPVMGIDGKFITLGSRDALKSQRDAYNLKGDIENYNEEVRLYPIRFRECFRTKDGDIGFNVKIIEERIDELKFNQPEMVRGDFEWVGGVFGGMIEFRQNPQGRWMVSKLISHNNKRILDGDIWFPDPRYSGQFTHGGDTFKANKTEGARMSKGGGSIFWNFDERVDYNKPIQQWVSHTTVATYLHRPPTVVEYCEDQLKACLYYNADSYPEIDVPAQWHYFEEKGFGGFMKYDIDPATKKLKNTPGFTSRGSQQKLFNAVRDYIEKHGHREKHIEFLMQCKEATSIEDFTNLDLLVANGGAIMGSQIVYMNDEQRKKQEKEKSQGKQIFKQRKYS